jgi:hypothetical protein
MAGKETKRGFARYWPRLLLIVPLLLVVYVPFYNRIEPRLADIPFFYWYQLAAILLGAALVVTVYWLEQWIAPTTEQDISEPEDGIDPSGTPGDIL